MSAASASAALAPVPLTIHACNGRFFVWEAAVCRTLALEYRIIGEFARNSKQIATDSLNQETNTTDASGVEGQNQASVEVFTVESLPMSLSAWQVLFLFEHASAALDLRDGSSLTSLRAATIGNDRAAVVRSSLKERLLEFQSEIKALAEHAEKMREKFQQRKPSPTTTRMEDDARKPEETSEEADDTRPTKRSKVEENSETISLMPSLTTASVPIVDSLLDSLLCSDSSLPLGSSLGVANAAQSLDASITAAPFQPNSVSLIGRSSATIDRKVLVLDMKVRNSYSTSPAYQRPASSQIEALLLHAICDSLGLPVDVSSIRHSSFTAFLSRYSCFVHQWQQGYFVMPGLHFGCDFVCYEDFPSQVHSTYLVRVMKATPNGQQEEAADGLPLLELANLGRMATSVNKAILLMQCKPRNQSDPISTPTDAFRSTLGLFRTGRIDCSTCAWSYQPQLALQSFSKQHLKAPFELHLQ